MDAHLGAGLVRPFIPEQTSLQEVTAPLLLDGSRGSMAADRRSFHGSFALWQLALVSELPNSVGRPGGEEDSESPGHGSGIFIQSRRPESGYVPPIPHREPDNEAIAKRSGRRECGHESPKGNLQGACGKQEGRQGNWRRQNGGKEHRKCRMSLRPPFGPIE